MVAEDLRRREDKGSGFVRLRMGRKKIQKYKGKIRKIKGDRRRFKEKRR